VGEEEGESGGEDGEDGGAEDFDHAVEESVDLFSTVNKTHNDLKIRARLKRLGCRVLGGYRL
jgi:hypothetical protein